MYVLLSENGYIDTNYVTTNSDGYNICKTRIRSFRHPEIGDKFLHVMDKKGTIGMIYNAEDMPFHQMVSFLISLSIPMLFLAE